jgi:hypothetical protein
MGIAPPIKLLGRDSIGDSLESTEKFGVAQFLRVQLYASRIHTGEDL